jgi:hypothetical protein
MTWIAVHVQPPLWHDLHSYEIRWAVTTAKAQFSRGISVEVVQPVAEDTDNRIKALMANDAECGFGRLTDLTPGSRSKWSPDIIPSEEMGMGTALRPLPTTLCVSPKNDPTHRRSIFSRAVAAFLIASMSSRRAASHP